MKRFKSRQESATERISFLAALLFFVAGAAILSSYSGGTAMDCVCSPSD
jgi:hypothetical protein